MGGEAGRCAEIAPGPGDVAPARGAVLRIGRCGPDRRWQPEAGKAIEEALRLIEPRARWRQIPDEALEGIFPGGTPVHEIARRGERWAFVATVGPRLEERVRERMDEGDYLGGLLLDAAGSAAVERLCDLTQHRCAGGGSSERFSPGYCSWSLAGQSGLFEILGAGDLGVTLLPGMMMRPLKSVTGLVVRADPAELAVPPEACRQCDAKGCTRRQEGFSGGPAGEPAGGRRERGAR